ncbi:hypothetical protein VKT23_011760 [Stygiomarasmius scandens]|uniref:Spindle and kinetochore-associated protein 3 n=1 Tax=Marasmiellus scandens TaxID=2682957 RepID=A0ABR1JBB4_9AGAR
MNYTLRQIKNFLRSGSTLTFEEKFKRSESFEHFKNPPSTENDLQQQLTDLSKQLQVLVDYISEKFEPLQDRLDLCIRHGQMEFDLLQYYFKKDDLLSTMTSDPEQDPPVSHYYF